MATLADAGISIDAVTAKLVEDGVQLFADAFDKLLGAVARKRAALARRRKLDRQTYKLPAALDAAVAGLARGLAARRARCGGCGRATPRCGPGRTRRTGSAGSTSSTSSWSADRAPRATSPRTSSSRASRTSCCSAWAARASAPRCSPRPSGGSRASRAARARFDRSGADPDLRKPDRSGPHALHRVEQIRQHARAQHLQAVFLRAGEAGGRAPNGRARASSPSPIRARSCRRSPSATGSAMSHSASRASAAATRCCRISAWCRPRRWASTSASFSPQRTRWCAPAPRARRRPTIRASCSARSWACSDARGATR